MRLDLRTKTELVEKVRELVREPQEATGFKWEYQRFDIKTKKWIKSSPMLFHDLKKMRAQDMLNLANQILGIPPVRLEDGRWMSYLPDAKTCAQLLERRATL